MREVYQQTKQELFEQYGSATAHTEENAKEVLKKFARTHGAGKAATQTAITKTNKDALLLQGITQLNISACGAAG